MAQVLVVANRTAESEDLLEALKARAAQGGVRFTLLVPASGHGIQRAANTHAGEAEGEDHLDRAVERLRKEGLEVEAQLGDSDPVAAVSDAANAEKFDEVIVSTLPTHLSKWLHLDLPRKVAHMTGLPVEHVLTKEKDPAR
ncbi:MAG: universal stress protein [Thermoleophilaceae bacterium]|nr:universal stress protein [Thermoleophilaceae bacterium]